MFEMSYLTFLVAVTDNVLRMMDNSFDLPYAFSYPALLVISKSYLSRRFTYLTILLTSLFYLPRCFTAS